MAEGPRRGALPEDVRSPWAARPYDLRHATASTWLNADVPSTQVAEWAGHSVGVLHQIYAKCIVGQEDAARKRIATALAVSPDAENLGTYWAQIPGIGR